jgi:CRP-like cAMP-binding protein
MMEPDHLREHPLLQGLLPACLDTLAQDAVVRRLRAGEYLWRHGERARGLHLLLRGSVRVSSERGGRRMVIHTEGPGATLGEVPLFASGSYPASAQAAGAVACIVLPLDTLSRAMAIDPHLCLRLLERMAGRVRGLITRLEDGTALSVRQRLLQHLHERAAAAAPASVFSLGSSQAQLAEQLGTVREVLVRELRALRAAGLIDAPRRGMYTLSAAADEAAHEVTP